MKFIPFIPSRSQYDFKCQQLSNCDVIDMRAASYCDVTLICHSDTVSVDAFIITMVLPARAFQHRGSSSWSSGDVSLCIASFSWLNINWPLIRSALSWFVLPLLAQHLRGHVARAQATAQQPAPLALCREWQHKPLQRRPYHRHFFYFYTTRYYKEFYNCSLNSSPPSAAYMRQWTGPTMVQVMAPIKPMLAHCQLDSWAQISVKSDSEFNHFHSGKCIWKWCLPVWLPFCLGGDELKLQHISDLCSTSVIAVLYALSYCIGPSCNIACLYITHWWSRWKWTNMLLNVSWNPRLSNNGYRLIWIHVLLPWPATWPFFKNLFRLLSATILAICDGKSTDKQWIPLTQGQ